MRFHLKVYYEIRLLLIQYKRCFFKKSVKQRVTNAKIYKEKEITQIHGKQENVFFFPWSTEQKKKKKAASKFAIRSKEYKTR